MTARHWRGVFVLSVVAQCVALYWPSPPSVSTGIPIDKGAHLLLFGTVAMVGVLARLPTGWLVAGLVVQAGASELLQGQLPGRGPDVRDFVADLVGIAIGIGAGLLARAAAGRTTSPG